MQRDVLELRCGRDVLLLARSGALPNTPMIAGKHRYSQSALDRFLAVRNNLDLLRRRWRVLQPSPTLAWHSDGDLKRMLKARIDCGRIDMVLVPIGETRARVDIRPFVEKARKAAADRQAAAQPARLQGGIQRPQMVTPVSLSVANWPLEQRVEEVARRAGRKVPGEAGHALKQLVSPEAIGLMAGLITAGALAQLTPFGWVADAAIIGIAFVFGGLAAVQALGDVIECFDLTNTAKSDADLERASEALSRAIVGIGLVALIALLHRFAKGSEKGTPKSGPKTGPTEADKIAALRSAKPVMQVKPVERAKPGEKAKPPENASANAANEAAAKELLEKAAEAEKSTKPALQKLAQDTGSKMEGLENRLKTPESLARKLNDTAPGQIADALRYTMVSDEAVMAENAAKSLAALEQQGYKVLKVKNTFKDGAPYKGVNTQIQAPNGQVFELQFHTPESFAMKQNTHALYEEMRVLPPTSERARAIQQELVKMNETLPNPPGLADSLGKFSK